MTGRAAPADGNPGDMAEGRITHLGQQVAWVWQELEVPVIAAVHGHALGGGLQIALGADIRFCTPDAQLSVREVHWGLVPDMTGTFVLSRLVRPDVAKELVFTAKVVSGQEGYELGLVTHVTPNPLEDALTLAREIAGRSPQAVRGSKHLLNAAPLADAAAQFAEERRVIGEPRRHAQPGRGRDGELRAPRGRLHRLSRRPGVGGALGRAPKQLAGADPLPPLGMASDRVASGRPGDHSTFTPKPSYNR